MIPRCISNECATTHKLLSMTKSKQSFGKHKTFAQKVEAFESLKGESLPPVVSSDNIHKLKVAHLGRHYIVSYSDFNVRDLKVEDKFMFEKNDQVYVVEMRFDGMLYYRPWGVRFLDDPQKISYIQHSKCRLMHRSDLVPVSPVKSNDVNQPVLEFSNDDKIYNHKIAKK